MTTRHSSRKLRDTETCNANMMQLDLGKTEVQQKGAIYLIIKVREENS